MKFGKGRFLFMDKQQNKRRAPHSIAVFGNPRALCLAALLAAMSLILGKFLQIPNPFQEFIRISFENTPIIMAGMFFGPSVGLVAGVIADILGCVLYGYSINPIITVGAGAIGLLSGVLSHYIVRRPLWLRTALAVSLPHIIGSVVIKSLGLAAWYLSKYNIGLTEFMLWRLLNYALIGVAEF
jgi:ECF transporter S component (folate family)